MSNSPSHWSPISVKAEIEANINDRFRALRHAGSVIGSVMSFGSDCAYVNLGQGLVGILPWSRQVGELAIDDDVEVRVAEADRTSNLECKVEMVSAIALTARRTILP